MTREELIQAVRKAIDLENVLLSTGLAALAAGLWWLYSPAVALVVVGGLFVVLGLYLAVGGVTTPRRRN